MPQPSKTHNRISASMCKMFRYDKNRHTPDDARNVLLVVVSLIAAVTFQAGVNPPGGVWQDGDHAGRAIYASQKVPFPYSNMGCYSFDDDNLCICSFCCYSSRNRAFSLSFDSSFSAFFDEDFGLFLQEMLWG
ncbi:hypothetical protein OIU84_015850 [Salix udensis]|uniref:PGG domain-containing protein n=1 Tax=Salix udensis TaxID=889485 RepID=A0AAD6J8C3_9ROSI|nr:hypothetical protein OIU84_015850 [Salix udensis]